MPSFEQVLPIIDWRQKSLRTAGLKVTSHDLSVEALPYHLVPETLSSSLVSFRQLRQRDREHMVQRFHEGKHIKRGIKEVAKVLEETTPKRHLSVLIRRLRPLVEDDPLASKYVDELYAPG